MFEELSGEWAVDFTGKAWDRFDKEAEVKVKAKGIEFISLAPKYRPRDQQLEGSCPVYPHRARDRSAPVSGSDLGQIPAVAIGSRNCRHRRLGFTFFVILVIFPKIALFLPNLFGK